MSVSRFLIASALLLAAASSPAVAGFPGFSPQFVGAPYIVMVDVLSSTEPQTFSFSGSAIDPEAEDTVSIRVGGSAPIFTRFSTVDGNPATFTLSGVGITRSSLGTYVLRLAAEDDSNESFGGATTVTIFVAPEPSLIFSSAAFSLAVVLRRRIARHLSAR